MDYTVEIVFRTKQALTEALLEEFAELGGGTSAGGPENQHLRLVLAIEAIDVRSAAVQAIDQVTARAAGTVVSILVLPVSRAKGPTRSSSSTRENGKSGTQAVPSRRRRGSRSLPNEWRASA